MTTDARIAVYGAGSWGTAFAVLCRRRGLDTTLICRTPEQAEEITASGVNARYLGDVELPDGLRVTHVRDAAKTVGAADLVISAVPSRAVGTIAPGVAAAMKPGAGVLSLTKGLDPATGTLLSDVWVNALGPDKPFCMLSGPNHAEEVVRGQPVAAVVAGDTALAEQVQALVSGGAVRIYTNDDLLGVELCAAAKNVVAIAAGMSDGLGFGDNAKASLITRGLAEMTRLGAAEGACAHTFRGLAGMGDLVATCTSAHSRNRRAGELIATGTAPDAVETRLGQVAEGLWSVERLLARAAREGVELPICAEVAKAVAGKPVRACMEDLMNRALVPEV